MKRLLLLLVATISILHASAQNTGISPSRSAATSIDSLAARVNQLEHDFNFLYCEYQLFKMLMDLKDLAATVESFSNEALINGYHSRYNRSFYLSMKDNYDVSSEYFQSLKSSAEALKGAIADIIEASNFSSAEIDILNYRFALNEKAVIKVDAALKMYDTAIEAYRKAR